MTAFGGVDRTHSYPLRHIDSFGKITMRTFGFWAPVGSATDEIELNGLLDDLRGCTESNHRPPHQPRIVANDDQLAWPLIPFPDGWYGG
jgi:hypothetical protein